MIPRSKKTLLLVGLLLLLVCARDSLAQSVLPKVTLGLEEAKSPSDFALTLQIVFLLTVLALAPSILIMMTSFTRLIVVFHFLRSALATQTVPSNQILVGLALFITFFVMKPVLNEVNETALQPYLKEEITQAEALKRAEQPVKRFMLKQTRETVSYTHLTLPTN